MLMIGRRAVVGLKAALIFTVDASLVLGAAALVRGLPGPQAVVVAVFLAVLCGCAAVRGWLRWGRGWF